jgi:hypothetical protein
MASPDLDERESTTLSSKLAQKGHFMLRWLQRLGEV